MDHNEKAAFCRAANTLQMYLGFEQVKVAFPNVPTEPYKRIAYASGLAETDQEALRLALSQHPETGKIIDRFFSNPFVRELAHYSCTEDRQKAVLGLSHSMEAIDLHVKLRAAGVKNADEWLKDVERHYESSDQFRELYLEGEYALAFRSNGLAAKLRPYGREGPDLQVSIGNLSLDVEVSRFRRDVTLEENMIGKIVEMPGKEQNLWSKIETKMKQLKKDMNGVILLSSDNVGIDDVEFGKIAEYLSCCGMDDKLCAIVFSDGYTTPRFIHNSCATVLTQELHSALQSMVDCLN